MLVPAPTTPPGHRASACPALIPTASAAHGKLAPPQLEINLHAADAPPTRPIMHIRLLGQFAVTIGATPVRLGALRGSLRGRLLACLALAPGHRLSRDRAIELLWPPEEAGHGRGDPRARLRTVVKELRRCLGDAAAAQPCQVGAATTGDQRRSADTQGWDLRYLTGEDQGVLALTSDVWIDAEAFERRAQEARTTRDLDTCRNALDLYTGLLLEGDFAPWAESLGALGRAERLRAAHAHLRRRTAGLCWEDDPAWAEALLRAALDEDAADELAARTLMELQARTGRLPDVARTYGNLANALAESGDSPDPASALLFRRLCPDLLSSTPLPAGLATILALRPGPGDAEDGELPATIASHIDGHGGRRLPRRPDGTWLAVFARPGDALAMAITAIGAYPVGARPRLALHTACVRRSDGEMDEAPLDYCVLLCRVAHPGQCLASEAIAPHLDATPSGPAVVPIDRYRIGPGGITQMLFQLTDRASPRSFPQLALPLARPTNLPAQSASYVERTSVEDALCALLLPTPRATARLVTVVGMGGGGKTRLALQVAASMRPAFPDGVWLVALEDLTDPHDLPAAVGRALDLREEQGRTYMEAIQGYLRPCTRPILLILDNCEHLLAGCARLAADLLAISGQVHLLATSREPLGMLEERVWELPMLTVPPTTPDGCAHAPEDPRRSEAVQLFIDRAKGKIGSDHHTTEAIRTICRRLEGIPLAIELAAAQLATHQPEEIAAGLDRALALLAGGNRGGPERHQTLRATLDWSYALLSEPERGLLARLSVFRGWRLGAAVAICAEGTIDREKVGALLDRLVLCAMVIREGEGRLRLREPVREYARERLEARP